MATTIDHPADTTRGPVDPATDMLRALLGDVQPRCLDDLLDLAGLVGEVDGGHLTAQTIGGLQ